MDPPQVIPEAEVVEDASSHIRTMADKHKVLKSQLEKAKAELAHKKTLCENLTGENYTLEGTLMISEQQLRSVNEKLFKKQTEVAEKEKLHESLLNELVDVQWKSRTASSKIREYENKYVDFQVEKAIQVDHFSDLNEDPQVKALKEQVDTYQRYATGLSNSDPSMTRIQSGETLEELEMRKSGIRDAFARREARAEGIYMEIDEKNDAVDNLKQAIQIKEKQNNARLRKLQREIEDKEQTENHLKQTVEYLDKQIDPSINKSNTSKHFNVFK